MRYRWLMSCTVGAILCATFAHAQHEFFFPTDLLPPPGSRYIGSEEFHALYHTPFGRVQLGRPEHFGFTQSSPPPSGIGDTTTHEFGSAMEADVWLGHNFLGRANASGPVRVRVTLVNQEHDRLIFDTEILSMTLTDTFLGNPFTIREDPNRASTGVTTIRPVAGGYLISSFFDIFTELSLAGSPFCPSTGSGRMILIPEPMSLMALGFGLATLGFARRRRGSRG